MHSVGFGAHADTHARLLILGSLPGRASLDAHEYYAHPRNAFWPIMGELIGAGPQLPYAKRIELLIKNRIALWDVCAEGFRPGSLDSNITKPMPNDFAAFFGKHAQIQAIIFNGQPAAALYKRLVLTDLPQAMQEISRKIMPSTSPANASLTFAQKLKHWKEGVTIDD